MVKGLTSALHDRCENEKQNNLTVSGANYLELDLISHIKSSNGDYFPGQGDFDCWLLIVLYSVGPLHKKKPRNTLSLKVLRTLKKTILRNRAWQRAVQSYQIHGI